MKIVSQSKRRSLLSPFSNRKSSSLANWSAISKSAFTKLRREGWQVNRKRVHRIWKSGGLGIIPEKTEEAQVHHTPIILMLRDNGFEVVDKSEFGPTPIVRKAIVSGELGIYPDKSGNKTLRELIR